MREDRSVQAPLICRLLLLTKHSTSTHAVGAAAKEIEEAHVSEDLELLADFGADVAVAELRAETADNADVRFLVLFGPAKDELLLRGKLMAGENAGTVKAEEDGGGGLGEDAAIQIAAHEEDGELLRDAAAHNLWWQVGGQRRGSGRTIWYQGE